MAEHHYASPTPSPTIPSFLKIDPAILRLDVLPPVFRTAVERILSIWVIRFQTTTSVQPHDNLTG